MLTNRLPSLARALRLVTADLRPLPDVLVIGGIRCGSTSVHRHLLGMGYSGASRKEVHYFDRYPDKPLRWYRSWFERDPAAKGVVDSTPSYLCTPGVAERARKVVPGARVIAMLRSPTDRAVSHFEWRREHGAEECETLEEAMQLEIDGIRTPENSLGCYLAHSRYDVGLEQWFAQFDPSMVCVLIAERLFSNDRNELARLHEFLGSSTTHGFPLSNARSTSPGSVQLQRGIFDLTIGGVERSIGRSTGWSR
jgi:hypothetical protein